MTDRDRLLALDAAWTKRRLFLSLNERVKEAHARDRQRAWPRFAPTVLGRPRKDGTRAEKRKPFVDRWDRFPEAMVEYLRARAERRVALVYRIFKREEKAYKDERKRLLQTAKPLRAARMNVVDTTDGSTFSTQGFGKNRYARARAEEHAMALEAAGFEVVIGESMSTYKPARGYSSFGSSGATYIYSVNTMCEPIDFEIVTAQDDCTLVEWVRRCWARGVNPRVYNPYLPPGFEERHGLDYFGGMKPNPSGVGGT